MRRAMCLGLVVDGHQSLFGEILRAAVASPFFKAFDGSSSLGDTSEFE